MAHTKGEWRIEKESNGQLWIATDASSALIAEICTGEIEHDVYEATEEEEENARLIAAAPAMLEALEIALNELEETVKNPELAKKQDGEDYPYQFAISTAKAAIKKAKGE